MTRRVSAHELADYARCPRAWWYDRSYQPASLPAEALEDLLVQCKGDLGRKARLDPEVQVLELLLVREGRLAAGRAAHSLDAQRPARTRVTHLALICALLLAVVALALLLFWA